MVCEKRQPFLPDKLYCVTGWPLGQSLSPVLHNIGFQALGIPAVYLRLPTPPEKLGVFMESLRLWQFGGCSVTIPHKTTIMPLLDGVSDLAREAGAVNTIFWREGRLWGENTDVAGFMAPLKGRDLARQNVLLLGAGGAARAALTGLRHAGCRQVQIATPSDRSHFALAEEFGCLPVCWAERHTVRADLIINATPLGMAGKHAQASPYDFSCLPGGSRVTAYDIVYNPLWTQFLLSARERGLTCISGREMFFRQANAQFQLWTGSQLPETARSALARALDAPAAA